MANTSDRVKSTTHLFAVNVRNKYEERDATLVGASALLTTTMLQQGKIIEALQEAGLRDQVKVMVAVVLRSLRNGRARLALMDAIDAVALAKKLVGVR